MAVTLLTGLAWLAATCLWGARLRSGQATVGGTLEWVGYSVTLPLLALGERSCADGLVWTALAALLCALWTGCFLCCQWQRLRRGRVGIGFPHDFLLTALATAAWTGALLILAVQLFADAPFPALILGILAFFLPVNALAEVFRAGMDARERP